MAQYKLYTEVLFNGEHIPLNIIIENFNLKYETIIKFSIFNVNYMCLIPNVSGDKNDDFMKQIIKYYPTKFGTLDDEGNVQSTPERHVEAIQQLVGDMFKMMDKINIKYVNGMLNYAQWYLGKYKDFIPETYEDFVSKQACDVIKKCLISNPIVEWEVVGFN